MYMNGIIKCIIFLFTPLSTTFWAIYIVLYIPLPFTGFCYDLATWSYM